MILKLIVLGGVASVAFVFWTFCRVAANEDRRRATARRTNSNHVRKSGPIVAEAYTVDNRREREPGARSRFDCCLNDGRGYCDEHKPTNVWNKLN